MVRNCAVINCQSGSRSQERRHKEKNIPRISFFSAPKCPILLEKWNEALGPVLKRKLTLKDNVCSSHFKAHDVLNYFETLLSDGTLSRILRGRPSLRPNAVPTLEIEEHRELFLEEKHNIQENLSIEVKEHSFDDEIPETKIIVAPLTSIIINHDDESVVEKKNNTEWDPLSMDDSNSADEKEMITEESFSVEYNISQLKEDLKTVAVPEFWSYARCGNNVLFHLLDPYALCTKLKCIVDVDMKFTAALADEMVSKEIDTNFSSIDDILKVLNKLTYIKVCGGTELEEISRDPACIGFIDTNVSYNRRYGNLRCMVCRVLRNRLLKKYNSKSRYKVLCSTTRSKFDLLRQRNARKEN